MKIVEVRPVLLCRQRRICGPTAEQSEHGPS